MAKPATLSGFVGTILALLFLLLEISPDVKVIGLIVIYSLLLVFVGMAERLGSKL